MCNYLNKYSNLSDAHYIRYTSKMIFMKNVFFICLVYFQNYAAIKKHYGFKAYHCPNILIPLAKWTIYASILKLKSVFLKFNAKKGGKTICPPTPPQFFSGKGSCPQLFRTWSGISEVRTADSYGASEFMSGRIFSCVNCLHLNLQFSGYS